MATAFVFPGQNSHSVGMGKDLYEDEPVARAILDRADEVLGFSLTSLMFDGPEEDLTATQNQQPAILAHSAACLVLLDAKGVTPAIVAGHSLGEYSALMAAGALGFDDALVLVRKRGELMSKAAGGAMAAVLGPDLADVEAACET
ncbi:MAG TPA: ACP S-malonyltransferase, partial [Armatimonadota bacterium]|nr:ACP S-malonyltransferase [Armatimonadota bacterium]